MWEVIKKIFTVIAWIVGIIAGIFVCAIGGYFVRFGVNFVCFVLDLFGVSGSVMDWMLHHQTAVWVICSALVPVLIFFACIEGPDSSSGSYSGGGGGGSYRSSDDEDEADLIGEIAAAMAKENEKIMFVDCSGRYRQWGDSFVDYSGKWCQWGDTFCDADGNYIRWGETYKDSSGAYRNWGDDFVDYAGNWVHIQ
ncbi:MAG: hypothetical protein E7434_01820 [Ruminococcaceae bacterium]|nr:hypothetical protein [Oscillospiraceae bacterium]